MNYRKTMTGLFVLFLFVALAAGCGNNNDKNNNSNNTSNEPSGNAGQGQTVAGDVASGEVVYRDNCMACHGNEGVNGHNGPNLQTSEVSKHVDQIVAKVTMGGNVMPSFKSALTEQQIIDVAAYVNSLTTK